MNNIQSFAQQSDQYARHRPQYPDALFVLLNQLCHGHDAVWDCATGNGQAAVGCAHYFARVEATDLSAEQIQQGQAHPRVRYSVAPAEQTPFERESFDLVTVAQAVHWFDREKFFGEVQRVLKPGGVLAVWGYGLMSIEPEIDRVMNEALLQPIDPFWASGNRLVMNGYRELSLPYPALEVGQELSMEVDWDLNQLLGYLRTWSAVKRYQSERGQDPVSQLDAALAPCWGDPAQARRVDIPLFLLAGRKP